MEPHLARPIRGVDAVHQPRQCRPLTAERVDARSLRVSGLRAAGLTAIAASETLEFTFLAGKTTATIEVVNQKVESIPRPPGPQ